MNLKGHVYFMFSDEQLKEKNLILSKTGKEFVPGTVVVNGKRRRFTQISKDMTIPRFIDTVVVTEGDISTITYTEPQVVRRS